MSRCLPSSLLLLLFLPLPLQAQGREWSIFASGGVWRTMLGYKDYYASTYQKVNPTWAVGATLTFPLADSRWAAVAGLEFDALGMRHYWSSPRSWRDVDSRLLLLYFGVGTGMRYAFTNGPEIRAGLSVHHPFATFGRYLLTLRHSGFTPPDIYLFTNDFGRILRPIIPMANLKVAQPLGYIWQRPLKIELCASMALLPVFKPAFYTPMNPSIGSLELGLSLDFSKPD